MDRVLPVGLEGRSVGPSRHLAKDPEHCSHRPEAKERNQSRAGRSRGRSEIVRGAEKRGVVERQLDRE